MTMDPRMERALQFSTGSSRQVMSIATEAVRFATWVKGGVGQPKTAFDLYEVRSPWGGKETKLVDDIRGARDELKAE